MLRYIPEAPAAGERQHPPRISVPVKRNLLVAICLYFNKRRSNGVDVTRRVARPLAKSRLERHASSNSSQSKRRALAAVPSQTLRA
jgi:hypothetical protein